MIEPKDKVESGVLSWMSVLIIPVSVTFTAIISFTN